MTLADIAAMQKQLDNHILDNHQLTMNETFRKRILAFLVELGELANETRCFKFWSIKPASEKDVILDEYVDGVHFLVSLGNDLGIDYTTIPFQQDGVLPNDASEMFLRVFGDASAFASMPSKEAWLVLFESYITLCFVLGFDYDKVVAGYCRKNQINHERQNTNY